MIVNLWSTPRTGSVWYSKHLCKLQGTALLMTEPFNRYHMNMYYYLEKNSYKNIHEYKLEAFYKEYYLDDDKFIAIRKVYDKRKRSVEQEEDYLLNILEKYNKEQKIIMHNHVSPINNVIKEYLLSVSNENIYIYRKNKRAQLGSYAIAYATKQFAAFTEEQKQFNIITTVEKEPLVNLIERIKIWDKLKTNNIIAYEDINFYDENNFPIKQNHDYKKRLTPESINLIDELVENYENSKYLRSTN